VLSCYHDTVLQEPRNGRHLQRQKTQKAARRTCPPSLWKVAVRKLDQLDSVISLHELRVPPGNRLKALKGDRQGQRPSGLGLRIRINDQYRICFIWTETGPEDVEIVDYH